MKWFILACSLELALLGFAALMSGWFSLPLFSNFEWNLLHSWIGIGSAIPPLLFFIWSSKSDFLWAAKLRETLEKSIRPLFKGWNVAQLAAISCIAGLSEEVLFRSIFHIEFAAWLGPAAGLILTSALFGCFHPITFQYGLITALMGCYLGWIWLITDNLLVPIVAHAAYDFAALVYFLRIQDRPGTFPEGKSIILPD